MAERQLSDPAPNQPDNVATDEETQLRLVIHAMPGLVSYVDRNFRYRFTNSRYGEWFGRPNEDFSGRSIQEAFGNEAFEAVRPYMERALRGETVTFERSYLYSGETPRQVRATYVPDQRRDGDIPGFVVLVEDISEQKRAEQAQKAIERQLTLLIEASSTLLATPESANVLRTILDLAKRFVEADAYSVWRKADGSNVWQIAAMEGLSGNFTRGLTDSYGDARNLPTEPLVIEDTENPPFIQDRAEAYKAEGIRSLITVPLRIHGEIKGTIVFYYRSRHRSTELELRVAAALGNLAAAALGTADLYDRETRLRRQAEAEERRASFLAEASQLLSSSLNYESTLTSVVDLAVPVFADWASVDILGANGEIRRVSVKHSDPAKIELAYEYRRRFPALETDGDRIALRTGKSILVEELPDHLLVQNARSPEHLECIRALGVRSLIFAPLVVNERSFGVLTFVTAESGRYYTKADLTLAEELARRAATAVDNARLFTESKHAEKALQRVNSDLRRANEDLNQFAYSASHDLQEPLRMLIIYSQMLERKYRQQLDVQGKEYIEYIIDGAKHMETLLTGLLMYMQSVNIMPQEIPPVDANAVMQKVLVNLSAAIKESGALVTCHTLPTLRVEEVHLLQLFQNMIGNAIKYRSENPPRIEVSSEAAGAVWNFCIKDNGIGIAPSYKAQVFGLFKRLHGKEKYAGSGIGLAICQKIVERYGGRIWVESEEGKGSSFCFTLPMQ